MIYIKKQGGEINMGKFIDETGNTYHYWTVVAPAPKTKNGHYAWLCRCVCGTERVVPGYRLRNMKSKSCGCFVKEMVSKPKGYAAKHRTFLSIKHGAKVRGVPFDLSKEQVLTLTSQKCFYCGQTPSQSLDYANRRCNGVYLYNGIDRLNSNIGYTEDNCVAACGQCNRAKNAMGYNEFILWIKRVYEQTAEQNAFVVPSIGGGLNQSSEKAVQLESSGGAR
jgi:5-methylcytosine-specific restriction endonuclease McrA